ncbi:MAG: hypothetical protein HY055_05910 [Magnetospirillum sp.]|nr:hypothetical protein [Magnetospirillum sp.]
MTHPRLLSALLVLALLLASPLQAGEKKEKEKPAQLPVPAKGQRYARLPTIALELWDKYGNFHLSSVDLLMLVPEEVKCPEKNLSDKMRKVLNGIPYEEYMSGNPAPMIKSSMLDLARKEPGCDQIREILISKMLFR